MKNSLWLELAVGLFTALILLTSVGIEALANQEGSPWQAPEAAQKVKNPVKTTPEGLMAAAELYEQRCVICHGVAGAANGPAAETLPRKPANFTNTKMMQDATDGELFWKITTGRAPMPSWENSLSEVQRWQLVNYLRLLTSRRQYRYLGKPTTK